MRIICVCTGSKFDYWYVDNLRHMIDNFSGLEYDAFEVLTESKYGGVYDKLQMFDRFRTGQNLYFDLDVVITGDCNKFLAENLTVCKAYWGEDYHSPINSSIISWRGDQSHVFKLFDENPDRFKRMYYRGIDQYIHKNFKYNMFYEGFCSYKEVKKYDKQYQVYIFNQNYEVMRWKSWCQKFLLAQRT